MTDASRLARLRKMAEENPHDELINFSLGNALLHADQVSEAAECFQRVLALNPRNSKAYQLLGETQVRCDQAKFAVQTLTNGYRVAQRQGDMMPMKAMAEMLKETLLEELKHLSKVKTDKLIERRIEKFSKMGAWAG